MLVIGLTGGIGTGKSQVARILKALGAEVIDADRVGHEIYAPDTDGWHRVVEAFGRGVLKPDGEVDRGKLGDLVFGDREKWARLNSITHPLITDRIRLDLQRMEERDVAVAVIEATLLLESPLRGLIDEVWVTAAPEKLVTARLARRSGLSEAEVKRRMNMQPTFSHYASVADAIIENGGDLEELRARVESLWHDRVKGRIG